MRILSMGALFFISSLFIIGCSKKDKVDPVLGAGSTELSFEAEGGKQNVEIKSNSDWELTNLPAWLQAKPSKGNGNTTVEFTIARNTTINEMTATISLKSGSMAPVSITVKQKQPDVIISDFTQHARGGEDIEILGMGFSDVAAENIVKVNGKPVTVKTATKEKLVVTIPAKTGDGKIEIKVNTKTATSETDFYYDWVGVVTTAYDGSTFPYAPDDILIDANGTIYLIDRNRILRIQSGHNPEVIAGSTEAGFLDETGSRARFNNPSNLARDAAGNLYVSDYNNQVIRKINTAGVVTTIAGSGLTGSDDGSVNTARFYRPTGIAVASDGTIYVADSYNHKIRKISNGQVTTLAGSGNRATTDGTGTAAEFQFPAGMHLNAEGHLILADSYSHKIRKITTAGVVTSKAGSGYQGFGDNVATLAWFQYPSGACSDAEGNTYVVDRANNAVRSVSKAGWVCTLAGGGDGVFGNTDGTGAAARFHLPEAAAIGKDGNIYIADPVNWRIRKIVLQ